MNVLIQTPTNRLEDSLTFYTKLGFEVISKEASVLISDGKVLIEINPDRYARAGVKLFARSWKETVEQLDALTNVIKTDGGYQLSDPNGVWIYLMESEAPVTTPLSAISPSVLGNFAGISLESTVVSQSLELWNTLGFTQSMGSVEQGWISLSNADGMTVSIMRPNICPHLFFNPSLTYFNGENNLAIIEKIRALKIPITEEITHFNKEGIVDNIIIRDPGGYGFFIFND